MIALPLAVRHPALVGSLAGVAQPGTVVPGRYDRARPPEQGRELASSLPDAEFRLAETGYSPVCEAPAAVATAVREVLARTRAAGG